MIAYIVCAEKGVLLARNALLSLHCIRGVCFGRKCGTSGDVRINRVDQRRDEATIFWFGVLSPYCIFDDESSKIRRNNAFKCHERKCEEYQSKGIWNKTGVSIVNAG
jgi:hypothetical protein